MLSEELIKKVKRIELSTKKMVDDVMSGQYRSHFKGHGVQFSEHRVYLPGDDIRHIDWKASARTREPVIKKFDEERELTVFLVVDVSASESFGSKNKIKAEALADVSGMLAYAATHTGDKVGTLLFGSEVEEIIPPKKGKKHVLRILRDLLFHNPRTRGTDLRGALEATHRVMKHSGIVFLISDFLDEDFEIPLRRLARKHDVVALWMRDRREIAVPKEGHYLFLDPETGVERYVDVSSYRFRQWLSEFISSHEEETKRIFVKNGIEFLEMRTHENYADALVQYFRSRTRVKK